MKFAVAKEHRDFFNKHQHIEFENLLTPDQVKDLLEGVDKGLAARLNISVPQVDKQSVQKLFMAGHDLWRTNDAVKKWVLNSKLAEISSQLLEQDPLRLGYDQFFPSIIPSKHFEEIHSYMHLLKNECTLVDFSSLQGVLCGLMICLSADPSDNPVDAPATVFSRKAGNGIFFKPEAMMDFRSLTNGGQYLLIVYVKPSTVYLLKETDPHTHFLKGLGHVFGDRLSDKWNPIVFR